MALELYRTTMRIPAAELGPESPLPILRAEPPVAKAAGPGIDEEMRRNLEYGQPHTLLPYAKQDSYDRTLRDRDVPCVVLQNEILTATFLPDYGGRLWSLVHRPTRRELLHRNPVVQPANLALRDAWLAGGVEWNLGATGHWPLTCSPMHTVVLRRPDGTPVLRMYEYERMRGLMVQLDFCLPAGAPVLSAHVTLRNPGGAEAAVYWWSNIAVPERDGVRVLAPAEAAYHFDYEGELRLVRFPDARHRSRTTEWRTAADYFFAIPEGERPWIAAVDERGSGLVHTSTGRLRGRKLFGWGTDRGGAHWQEWLGAPSGSGEGPAEGAKPVSGSRYLEIQAGLARTQLEHLPMPGGAVWSWTEAFGLLEVGASAVRGRYREARESAGAALGELVPEAWLAAEDVAARECAELPPTGTLFRGSGWGALERVAGFLVPPVATPFPDHSLSAVQEPWLRLARGGAAAEREPDPLAAPPGPVRGEGWRRLLAGCSVRTWEVELQSGRLAWAADDPEAARAAWERSIALAENPWALRDLAESGVPEAADLLCRAHALRPDVWQLTVETLEALLAADRAREALSLIDDLDAGQRRLGRIRLLECRAAVAGGAAGRAAAVLSEGFDVHNLREGEEALEVVWRAVFPGVGLPARYDFRMRPGE